MSAKIGDAGYRILGPIASGGMGEVFKAEHVITRRLEAIKVLNGAGTAEESERFLREIQLQASLSHPNIAAVYNAFRVGDDLVMVMELVEGEALKAILERARLSLPAAVSYAVQALDAIGYAHAHGVIHRDITPANIIITPKGVVKITDFGLAKSATPSTVSRSGLHMGSPYYMSPEQVKDATRASARSDIYSLGAVLYEMTTGKKPFEGEGSFAIMQAQVERPPVPPVQIEPSIPAALNQAILRALEKDPERRFGSAAEFREAIETVMAAGVVPAPRRAPAARGRNLPAPYMWAAALCVVILPVAVMVETARRHPSARPAPPRVEIKAPEAEPSAPPPPPAQAPAAESAALPTPVRRRARPRPPKPDLTPRVTGEDKPSPVRILEPAPAVANSRPPSRDLPETPAVQVSAAPAEAAVEAEAAQPASAAVAAASDAPADAAQMKEKKAHGRFRRALGKILSPLH